MTHHRRKIKIASSTFQIIVFFLRRRCIRSGYEERKKKTAAKRQIVRLVTSPDTQTTLIELFEKAVDIKFLDVLYRLNCIDDLVTVNARYHDTCNTAYRNKAKSVNSNEKVSHVDKVVTHITSYIPAHEDQCQFSLTRILSTFDIDE